MTEVERRQAKWNVTVYLLFAFVCMWGIISTTGFFYVVFVICYVCNLWVVFKNAEKLYVHRKQ